MIMKKLAIILIMAASLFATGCKKLPEFTGSSGSTSVTPTTVVPEVVTLEAMEITENSAILNGVISNYYGNYQYEGGFFWGTTAELDFVQPADGISQGMFSASLTGLTTNTTYYYKACAFIGESEENAGYGEVKSFTTEGGAYVPLEASDTLNFDGKMVVLLEDYLGVRCLNCPEAEALELQLQEENENHLVVLSVHPKSALQNPSGGFPDFRTDDGNEWNNEFNIMAYPLGLVNRTGGVLGASQWTSAVNNIIGNDAPVRLIVKTAYNETTRALKISIHSKFLQNISSNDVRLTVCMMEDNILGKQVTAAGVDTAYMHRHVFRGTVDGQTWGRVLDTNANSIEAGRNFITNIEFTVNDEYNADEFYIVAFISNYETKEVLMASEKKIK